VEIVLVPLVTLQLASWHWLVAAVQRSFVVHVADPHVHGYAELKPVPSKTLQSANWHWFMAAVQTLLMEHVWFPHMQG
jgi:hypothetical protein